MGSRKFHKYDKSDQLTEPLRDWVFYEADESNLENITASGGAYDDSGSSIYDFGTADNGAVTQPIPATGRYFKPRHAIYKNAEGTHTRKMNIPSLNMYQDLFNRVSANINTTFIENVEGVDITFALVDLKPQYVKVPISFDTGQTDGDLT